jgi:cation diffusion facilitator CzcD-associated flavoprotein CzcO
MHDHRSNNAAHDSGQADETFELVVVGAGVAGLNALYAATHYLPNGAKVLLVDQKQAAGGMWNTAYDYVRLHQPDTMFTVGDMRWSWDKPSHYLAQRVDGESIFT